MKGHQNESGDPTTNRGIPPHKGGYHSGKNKTNTGASRIWFEVITEDGKKRITNSPWKP